jgi:hypothetical protein
MTAEAMVANNCGITLPRVDGNAYVSLLDECGGHTAEYHFHERLSCLYNGDAGGHSTQVGVGLDGTALYGKWEDRAAFALPALDACGAHFGVTPDSNGASVYHHHVSDLPPFTFGCYGPATDSSGQLMLVSLTACRALYSGCGDGDEISITTAEGSYTYDQWCPCFLGGRNMLSTDGGSGRGPSPPSLPPAPAPPAPPLSSMTLAAAVDAQLSEPYSSSAAYAAGNAVDGSFTTSCFSSSAANRWLSLRVASGTPIGWVAVHNRRDRNAYLLGDFEVWVGSAMGDVSSVTAQLCGSASYDASHEPVAYLLWCGGYRRGDIVTLRQVTAGRGFLSIAEMQVYEAASG